MVILAVAVAFSRAQRRSPGLLGGPLTSVSEFVGRVILISASADEAGTPHPHGPHRMFAFEVQKSYMRCFKCTG